MSLRKIENTNTTPNITTNIQPPTYALPISTLFQIAQITNKDELLTAVTQDGTALRRGSDALKNDMEVVLRAVQQNGLALEYASDAIKGSQDVVLAAVQNDPYALRYAAITLQNFEPLVS